MPDKDPAKWDYDDLRHGRDQTFLQVDQWRALLEEAGAERVISLPRATDVTGALGQQVIAARLKADRARLTADDVRAHLAERVPEAMVPTELQIVDALPLTANGKLDHATLRGWLPRAAQQRASAGGEPADDLERRVAVLWSEALGLERVAREQDFFALGGDSLIVAKLAGRLRDELPEAAHLEWDDLVRQILNRPTVAAALRAAAQRARGRRARSPGRRRGGARRAARRRRPAARARARGQRHARALPRADRRARRRPAARRPGGQRGGALPRRAARGPARPPRRPLRARAAGDRAHELPHRRLLHGRAAGHRGRPPADRGGGERGDADRDQQLHAAAADRRRPSPSTSSRASPTSSPSGSATPAST